MSNKIKNIPQKIYLQIGEDIEDVEDFNEFVSESITWCSERINKTDIEYIINLNSIK